MSRWISLTLAVVALTLAASVAVLYVPDAGPSASVPTLEPLPDRPPPTLQIDGSRVYDFGAMLPHTKGAHTWEVKNTGPGDLQLWVEETSCACTVAKLQKDA